MKNILDKIYSAYNQKTFKKEDNVVFKFFDNLKINENNIEYLEVGSGLCRFPMMVRDKYKNFNIKCLEKNVDLVNLGVNNGLNATVGDIVELSFNDEKFNVIHCSHVIEHLDYKSIVSSLDEMFRVLKSGGYLILRSPLMYPGFYFDIDHVRPYPPESILNYFNNRQQQRVGSYKIFEVLRWYRREAASFYNSNCGIVKIFNYLLKLFWLVIGFPRSKPNGYILVIKKN